jgi:hypothetical protein
MGFRGVVVAERYSLEHVEGIRNEGKRADGITCLCRVNVLRQGLSTFYEWSEQAKHVEGIRTSNEFYEKENNIKDEKEDYPGFARDGHRL